MSTNIKWSYQKKFQNGEVILNTGTVLGYKKSKKGEYMIAEDEAETVRRVFREYVAGIPVPQICRRLEASGIKTKRGSAKWSTNAVLGIIKNEKYTGNAILGKTFKPDVLSKRRIKNTGQAPMYYAESIHLIVDEESGYFYTKEENPANRWYHWVRTVCMILRHRSRRCAPKFCIFFRTQMHLFSNMALKYHVLKL